jgi:predicted nucleic acid-binding protein
VTEVSHYLVDTGVFILYLRRDHRAIDFLRSTEAVIYYSRVTRKELLRPPISARERTEVLAVLQRYRIVNPDPQITDGFAALLENIPICMTIWLMLSLQQLPGRRTLRWSLPTLVTLLLLRKSTSGAFQKTEK